VISGTYFLSIPYPHPYLPLVLSTLPKRILLIALPASSTSKLLLYWLVMSAKLIIQRLSTASAMFASFPVCVSALLLALLILPGQQKRRPSLAG
jgi:hypothetical protein